VDCGKHVDHDPRNDRPDGGTFVDCPNTEQLFVARRAPPDNARDRVSREHRQNAIVANSHVTIRNAYGKRKPKKKMSALRARNYVFSGGRRARVRNVRSDGDTFKDRSNTEQRFVVGAHHHRVRRRSPKSRRRWTYTRGKLRARARGTGARAVRAHGVPICERTRPRFAGISIKRDRRKFARYDTERVRRAESEKCWRKERETRCTRTGGAQQKERTTSADSAREKLADRHGQRAVKPILFEAVSVSRGVRTVGGFSYVDLVTVRQYRRDVRPKKIEITIDGSCIVGKNRRNGQQRLTVVS